MNRRLATTVLAVSLIASVPARANPPYPPYPPYPPPPVRAVDPTPPPLSPLMRAIYAPFYVTGLVLRYGVYYIIVAPIEVLTRTVAYGVEGGVERRPPRPLPPPPPGDES